MGAIGETGEELEIDIKVIGPITGGLFPDMVCDTMDEDLNLIDRYVGGATAVK